MTIPTLDFGRTGHQSTRLIFGAAALFAATQPEADATLEQLLEAGVNHIDTSDVYGPHVTNQIIREALHPYRDGLVIATKVGRSLLAEPSP